MDVSVGGSTGTSEGDYSLTEVQESRRQKEREDWGKQIELKIDLKKREGAGQVNATHNVSSSMAVVIPSKSFEEKRGEGGGGGEEYGNVGEIGSLEV